MSIRVEFPDELLVATQEDPQAFARQVMIYTLGHLYEQGKISSGIGAQVLVQKHETLLAMLQCPLSRRESNCLDCQGALGCFYAIATSRGCQGV